VVLNHFAEGSQIQTYALRTVFENHFQQVTPHLPATMSQP